MTSSTYPISRHQATVRDQPGQPEAACKKQPKLDSGRTLRAAHARSQADLGSTKREYGVSHCFMNGAGCLDPKAPQATRRTMSSVLSFRLPAFSDSSLPSEASLLEVSPPVPTGPAPSASASCDQRCQPFFRSPRSTALPLLALRRAESEVYSCVWPLPRREWPDAGEPTSSLSSPPPPLALPKRLASGLPGAEDVGE